MGKLKVGLPNAQYLINILIAMAIIAFVFKMLPDKYTSWFRW